MPEKPTEQEDEYFARLEFERRRKVLDERDARTAEDIPSVMRGRCPKCGAGLIPVPYRGIELDKCSRCQRVWLDFGELDRIVIEDAGQRPADLQLTRMGSAAMTRSKKALERQTSPQQQAAAGQQAEARKAQSQKATSAAASETRNARQFTRTRASAIQAHSRARGQRRQARRDSR
jgi:uncharacterized protein